MKNKFCITLLIFACLIVAGHDADAQCAMCKAVIESNQKNGGGVGAGLNKGILYLMSLPYIMVFLGGLFGGMITVSIYIYIHRWVSVVIDRFHEITLQIR